MIQWLRTQLSTTWGRLGTGAATIAAAVTFAQSGQTWSFEWDKFAALILTLGAWLTAELLDGASAYPHDTRLFLKIMDQIPESDREFLRTHDFGGAFAIDRTKGATEISYWQGRLNTFLDRALQRRWQQLYNKAEALRALLAQYTSPHPITRGFQTVLPIADDDDFSNLQRHKNSENLNKSATDFVKELDSFEIFARRRLRV